MALLNNAKMLKERIAVCGSQGADYEAELQRLEINPQIGLAIAKKLLQPSGYQFLDTTTGLAVDVASQVSYNLRWICIAPEATARAAFGFEHAEQYANFQEKQMKKEGDSSDPLAFAAILAKLGKSGADGLTYQEISPGSGSANTKNVSLQVDRLYALGLVTKNAIMPNEKIKKMNSTTVVHLRRYARQYNPTEHNVQLYPSENIRDELFRFIRRILDTYEVETLPCADLTLLFRLSKKATQNLRAQMVRNDTIQCIETVSAPIKRGVNATMDSDFGFFRTMWVIQRGSGAMHPHYQAPPRPQEITYRSRNLSMYEQIDTAITATGERGLSTMELRRITGLNAKRTSKLSEALRKVLKYPTIRELEGKNMVYRLISHAVAEGTHGNAEEEDEVEEGGAVSSTPTPDKAANKPLKSSLKKAPKPKKEMKKGGKKRRRNDSSESEEEADSDFESDEESDFSGDDDNEEEDENEDFIAVEPVLKRQRPSPQVFSSTPAASSSASPSKQQSQSQSQSQQQPLLQRAPMILDYLQSKVPYYCGCVPEVTKQVRETTGTFVDRKTILRAVKQLEANNQIRSQIWERNVETIETFGAMHGNQIMFLLLVQDDVQESDEDRIAEYCKAYKASRQPSKAEQKRRRLSAATPAASPGEKEEEEDDEEEDKPLEMDVDNSDVMGHRLLQQSTQPAASAAMLPPTKPLAKRGRKPKVKPEGGDVGAIPVATQSSFSSGAAARRVSFQVAPTAKSAAFIDAIDVDEPLPQRVVAAVNNRLPVVPLQAHALHTEVKPALLKQPKAPAPAKSRAAASSKKAIAATSTTATATSAEEMAEMDRQHKQDQQEMKLQQQQEKERAQAVKLQPAKKAAASPAATTATSSSPDDWNDEQDRALLESFLVSFLIRSARQGLPMILKPFSNIVRGSVKGKQPLFDLYPWQSPTLGIDFGAVQLAELKQAYTTTSGIVIEGQGLPSCRRRLPVLLKGIRDVRQLVVQLLWMGPKKMKLKARDLCMFVMKERYSRLSLPVAMKSHQQEAVAVVQRRQMIINRLLQYCEPGMYPSFTIQELLQPLLSSNEQAEDQEDEQYEEQLTAQEQEYVMLRSQAIAIVRELYLHHVLRREGTDEELKDCEDTRFYLSPAFASSVLERPFGSFFYDVLGAGDGQGRHAMIKDENIEEDPVSSDYKEAKALLTVAIATEHNVIVNEHAAIRADIIDENRVVQRPIDEISNLPVPPQNEIFSTNTSKEAFDKRKSFERVDAQLSIDTTAVRLTSQKFFTLTQQQQVAGSMNQEAMMTLPWIDPSNGEVKPTTLRMYAVQVMSYLAEHPAGTIKQIHALLFILSLQATQALMDMLVVSELVRVRQPAMTVKLANAFTGLDFWTTRNMGSEVMAEVVYELVV